MKGILCIIILARIGFVSAQSLEAQVVGSTGNIFSGSTFSVSSTTGESAIFLLSGSGYSASQGFQQPYPGSSSSRIASQVSPSDIAVWIYPNPVSKELYIVPYKNTQIKQVVLFTITGEILESKPATGLFQQSIQMHTYANGLYVVKVEMENGETMIKKVVKE